MIDNIQTVQRAVSFVRGCQSLPRIIWIHTFLNINEIFLGQLEYTIIFFGNYFIIINYQHIITRIKIAK